MSEIHVEPSELHWKKELTSLRKAARLLRDPETSSSWKSPLSSRSGAVNYANGTRRRSTGENHSGRYTESESRIHLKGESNPTKVSLYNWRQHPNKSSIRVMLDENEESLHLSSKERSSNLHEEDVESDTYLEDPVVVLRVREGIPDKPVKKTVKKLKKRSSVSRQRIVRNSKTPSSPSISLVGKPTPAEQFDENEYYNSEDLQSFEHESTQKSAYTSRSASPLLSRCENWSDSPKFLRNARKAESSSYTPASTSSYNRYRNHNPSTVESWDGTTASFDGDLDPLDLPRRQGCGIPCYWSKRSPKLRGWGGFHSPSLSDTIRRKGSSILCGSQTMRHKRQSLKSSKRKHVPRTAQGLKLSTKSFDGRGSSIDTEQSDGDLSTNFGELDLEALSRLDGRRWSLSCRSQEGLEIVDVKGSKEGSDHTKSLSEKYRPTFFDELIGQNIVVQSLNNAVSRGRIAPLYLFHGPRGTGKTSTARIFTAALNCLATEDTKPCGFCRECSGFMSSKGMGSREVDATNKKGIDRVRYLMKTLSMAPPSYFSRYTVFIIDQCHLLPSKTWSAFLKFLEELPEHVVLIFITTDLENLPRNVLSRCQKYLFNKIKDADIVTRLKKLSADENLDVESHALELIAMNADGSLRDAETMLEQLSLIGKRITASLVNELVGVVSDEKLLDLLELAMSSDTAETVKLARELMDSGVDPMALMSQLAGLIMDIIAGTHQLVDSTCNDSFFAGRNLTEAELERLKQALKLLSEAEKQLRLSSERSTWFTAALLQLGSVSSSDHTQSSSSRSSKTREDQPGLSSGMSAYKKSGLLNVPLQSTSSALVVKTIGGQSSSGWLSKVDNLDCDAQSSRSHFVEGDASATAAEDIVAGSQVLRCIAPEKLNYIWERCIDRCHSKTLRQLLREYGKLVSISKVDGILIATIEFKDGDIKSRAERFLSSITNSIEIVLRRNVEVRIGLAPIANKVEQIELPNSSNSRKMGTTEVMENEQKSDLSTAIKAHTDLDSSMKELNNAKGKILNGKLDQSSYSSSVLGEYIEATSELPCLEAGNPRRHGVKEKNHDTPAQSIQTIIEEQRLESAWLQAAEKGSAGSLSRFKPEKNQVLPQDDIHSQNRSSSGLSSQNLEVELNSKTNDVRRYPKEQSGQRFDRYPMSPSLLHNNSIARKENLGYESGSSAAGCNGLLCWKSRRSLTKVEMGNKQQKPVRSSKGRWLGQCPKTKKIENRFKR